MRMGRRLLGVAVSIGVACGLLAAGAALPHDVFSDAAWIAVGLYAAFEHGLPDAARHSRNGRRLLAIPELRDDVQYRFERDRYPLVAAMAKDGVVRVLEPGRA